jgi:hypothetical protein
MSSDAVATTIGLPGAPDEITAAWLTAALQTRHPDVEVTSVHLGEILWATATKVRILVDYNDAGHALGLPPTFVVKAGFGGHELAADMLCFYEAEVAFYRDIAPTLDVGLPECFFAAMDSAQGQALVVLEDLLARNVRFGADGGNATPTVVAGVLAFLASVHAATWMRDDLAELSFYPGSLRGVLLQVLGADYWGKSIGKPRGAAVPESLRDAATVRHMFKSLWDWDREHAVCIAHGDAHLGNAYVARDGKPGLVDWQMAGRGHWAQDVAYLIACALDPATRRTHERSLLRGYLEQLSSHGITPPGFDDAWDAYRRHVVQGIFWTANADEMYPEPVNLEIIGRAATAIDDLGSLDLIVG